MMRKLLIRSEKGIALVMVLVLSAISLAIMSVLIYMVTSSSQISGMQRKFHTALDGSYGGAQTYIRFIRDHFSELVFNQTGYINFVQNITPACFTQKITLMTSAANWAACPVFNDTTSVVIDPGLPPYLGGSTYDIRYDYVVPGIPPTTYRVFMKIASTVEGNTIENLDWQKGGTPDAETGVPPPKSPYMYRIEVLTINLANPNDRAGISMLYAY